MTATTTIRYVKVAVAARQLQKSEQSIRAMFDRGDLTGIRSANGYRLIDMDSVQRYRDRKFLSVQEAACRLGVSRETVAKRFDAGELAGHRSPAGHRLIDPEAL